MANIHLHSVINKCIELFCLDLSQNSGKNQKCTPKIINTRRGYFLKNSKRSRDTNKKLDHGKKAKLLKKNRT